MAGGYQYGTGLSPNGGTRPPNITDLNNDFMRDAVSNVRLYMRDFSELNRMTKGVDHSDRHIAWAILDTLSDFASTPPFIGQSLQVIMTRGWQHILIRGAAAALLESLMFLHMRNHLAYSDGGVTVQTENPQMLQAAIQMLKNGYEQKKKQALIAANIEGAIGGPGVHSEYLYINSFWGGI